MKRAGHLPGSFLWNLDEDFPRRSVSVFKTGTPSLGMSYKDAFFTSKVCVLLPAIPLLVIP